MQFTLRSDPLQPSPDSDIPPYLVVRVMSWVTTLIIEGFASCAVGIHPELVWLVDDHSDHSDRTNAPSSPAMYRPSPAAVAPCKQATSMRRGHRAPGSRPSAFVMIGWFVTTRQFGIVRIGFFHRSAWITSVLVNNVSRVRFVCFDELVIPLVFLWLATLHVVAAWHGAAHPASLSLVSVAKPKISHKIEVCNSIFC
jgi:hypothetical protein